MGFEQDIRPDFCIRKMMTRAELEHIRRKAEPRVDRPPTPAFSDQAPIQLVYIFKSDLRTHKKYKLSSILYRIKRSTLVQATDEQTIQVFSGEWFRTL